jgi:hypothetical protein
MRLYQATLVNHQRGEEGGKYHWFVVAKNVQEAVKLILPNIENVPNQADDEIEELKLLGTADHNLILPSEAPSASV